MLKDNIMLNTCLIPGTVCRFIHDSTKSCWNTNRVNLYKRTGVDIWQSPFTLNDISQANDTTMLFLRRAKNIEAHLARYHIDRMIFIKLHGTDKHHCYKKFIKLTDKKELASELIMLNITPPKKYIDMLYEILTYTSRMLI